MAKYTFDTDEGSFEYDGPMTREQAQQKVTDSLSSVRQAAERPVYPRDIGGGSEYDQPPRELQPPPAPPKEYESMNPVERAYADEVARNKDKSVFDQTLTGIRGAGRRMREGIQQNTPLEDPSEEEMARTRGMEATPSGMAGGMLGDVGVYAIPGAGVEATIAKGLSKFPKVWSGLKKTFGGRSPRPTGAAPVGPLKQSLQSLLPATVTGGAEMGLQPVMEGESRLKNVAMGGGLAALPGVGMRTGRRAARPMEASPPAQTQFDKGYDMSLGQATQGQSAVGDFVNLSEEASGAIPILGNPTKKNRAVYGDQVVREASRRAFPEGPPPDILPSRDTPGKPGYFGINEAQFNRAYPEIMGDKVMPMSLPELGTARASSRRIANKSDDRDRERLSEDLNAFMKRSMTGDEWKRADTRFRKRINEYWDKYKRTGDQGDMEMVSAYRSARDSLTEARDKVFSPDEVEALGKLDQQYAVARQLERAADQPDLGPGRTIEARNLVKEVESDTPMGLKVRGRGRLQDLTDPSSDLIAQELGDNPMQRRRGLQLGMGLAAVGTGLTLPSVMLAGSHVTSKPGVARFMTGQGARQKAIAEALRKGNNNLYKFPVMGGVGFMGAKELEKQLEE